MDMRDKKGKGVTPKPLGKGEVESDELLPVSGSFARSIASIYSDQTDKRFSVSDKNGVGARVVGGWAVFEVGAEESL